MFAIFVVVHVIIGGVILCFCYLLCALAFGAISNLVKILVSLLIASVFVVIFHR